MKPKPIPDPHPASLAAGQLGWTRGPLAEGLACYHSGQFFLAHEHWEAVWLTLPQPEKDFLQALIQVAAAFHHLQRGNLAGARSLLTRALRRLRACPADFGGISLDQLCAELHDRLQRLTAGTDPARITAPSIRLSGNGTAA